MLGPFYCICVDCSILVRWLIEHTLAQLPSKKDMGQDYSLSFPSWEMFPTQPSAGLCADPYQCNLLGGVHMKLPRGQFCERNPECIMREWWSLSGIQAWGTGDLPSMRPSFARYLHCMIFKTEERNIIEYQSKCKWKYQIQRQHLHPDCKIALSVYTVPLWT